ncbi:MAG: TfoX/Sxy family protein [Planctomycetota bacterium]
MSYDEGLAERIRRVLAGDLRVTTRRMFGGIAWLCNGHMTCGIVGDDLMLRLGDEGAAAALKSRGVRPMDFTGKPLRSMVYVDASEVRTQAQVKRWVARAVEFTDGLPPKAKAKAKTARRPRPGR